MFLHLQRFLVLLPEVTFGDFPPKEWFIHMTGKGNTLFWLVTNFTTMTMILVTGVEGLASFISSASLIVLRLLSLITRKQQMSSFCLLKKGDYLNRLNWTLHYISQTFEIFERTRNTLFPIRPCYFNIHSKDFYLIRAIRGFFMEVNIQNAWLYRTLSTK